MWQQPGILLDRTRRSLVATQPSTTPTRAPINAYCRVTAWFWGRQT